MFVSGRYIHHGDHGGKPVNFGFVIADSIDEDESGKGEACVNPNNDNTDDNDEDNDVPVASVLSKEGDTDLSVKEALSTIKMWLER